MINQNTFNTGLNQDTSKLKYPQTSYYDAENFKIVAQSGSSTYALENTKGTITSFKLPDKIHAVFYINPNDYTGTLGIQIFGNYPTAPPAPGVAPPISIPNIENQTPKGVVDILLANTIIAAQVAAGYFTLEYNNQYFVIVGLSYAVAPLINNFTLTPNTQQAPELTPEINNPQIIGAINITNTLVIFSTEGVIESPGYNFFTGITSPTTTGQIWKINYNADTDAVINLGINDELVPQHHLLYHANMNLTQFHKVSGEGRYETKDYQKAYFTDFYNSGRLFNVADPNSFAMPLDLIQYKPVYSTDAPVVKSVNDGGFIKSGKIQYFYHLLHNNGVQTTFSPCSYLISLWPPSINSNYENIAGAAQGTNSGKSVTLKINNIDILYDVIKVGYILWEAEDLPTVRIFYEGAVPPTGNITLTHSGTETETSLDILKYRSLQSAWDICKGFTQKKNILIAHNTKTIPFNMELDCRAYRFNNSGFADLYDKSDNFGNPKYRIRGTDKAISIYNGLFGGSWEDIGFDEDLINPYNDENPNISQNPFSNGDWYLNSQFKYQSDGITLGGEGPIIKYEFYSSKEVFTEIGDTFINTSTTNFLQGPPLTTTAINITPTFPLTYLPYFPGTGNEYPLSGLASMKNPLVNAAFTGYADGEVYRIGNVFFNDKHLQSFVNWIGDIKFPMQDDKKHDSFYYDPTWNRTEFRQQGLRITLNTLNPQFDAVKNVIKGWSFVRIKRETRDKTRLGTGILNGVEGIVSDSSNSYDAYKTTASGVAPFGQFNPDLATFECPNFKFGISDDFVSGDHIRFLKKLTQTLNCRSQAAHNAAILRGDHSRVIKYGKTDTVFLIDATNISNLVMNISVPVSLSGSTIGIRPGLDKTFKNMSSQDIHRRDNTFAAWGGLTNLISTQGSGGSNLYRTSTSTSLLPWDESNNIFTVQTMSTQDNYYQLQAIYVSYERYLTGQYNGNQWETRKGQEYIGVGHYQPFDSLVPWIDPGSGLPSTNIFNNVFGGDVVNTMFDYIKLDANTTGTEAESGWDTPAITNGSNANDCTGIFVPQIFPSECAFDLNLRYGRHVNTMVTQTSNPHHEQFVANPAYSQEDTSRLFFSEPFNFREVNEQPYRMWSAQKKLDGEFPDSWTVWLTNDFLDTEGTFGPINKMILQDDKVLFYQDYAVGVTAVEEQQVLNSNTTTGSAGLVLGEGTVLQRYDYLTKTTGSKHQWAVIHSPKGVYHFDVTLKKLFLLQVQGDKFGLTDIKGLNTTFQKFITQSVQTTDVPLVLNALSIHGEWNPKYNEVYFTIADGNINTLGSDTRTNTRKTLTISYNELTDSFDSFHTWYPTLFHRFENRLLTIASRTDGPVGGNSLNLYSKTMFEQNKGPYNIYHHTLTSTSTDLFPSKLTIIISPQGSKDSGSIAHITKKLDVIEFITQVFDTVGVNVPFETINSIRVFDDYQDTGVIPLIYAPAPGYNIKKRFSSWRFNTLRDITSPNKARLRDKTFTVEIVFNNSTGVTNRRFIMNDIISQYEPDPFVQPV